MKFSPLLVGCAALAVLSQTALGWTNEDHEIFDIVHALEKAEGKGTTFYTFLNTTKSATEKEISKLYKKRSLELHPDKNPNNKKVADRFARLGVIAGILRDEEKRARYNHFHDNGVPRWRGTGYYYSRYRPGLATVIITLTLFSCGVHYFILLLQWGLSVQRIRAFHNQAIEYAWGPTKKPLAGRKRIRVKTGDQVSPAVPGINYGRPTKPGTTIEMVIEGDKVFVVNKGVETLLTEDAAEIPSFSETWIPVQYNKLYSRLTGTPIRKKKSASASRSGNNTDGGVESDSEEEVVVKDTKTGKETVKVVKKPKGPGKGVLGDTTKIGGKRRVGKPVKRVTEEK